MVPQKQLLSEGDNIPTINKEYFQHDGKSILTKLNEDLNILL